MSVSFRVRGHLLRRRRPRKVIGACATSSAADRIVKRPLRNQSRAASLPYFLAEKRRYQMRRIGLLAAALAVAAAAAIVAAVLATNGSAKTSAVVKTMHN